MRKFICRQKKVHYDLNLDICSVTTFVLNFQNSSSKVWFKLTQMLCLFEFRDALVELDFLAGGKMFLEVSFFLLGFPGDQVC
jgi:hypothetical protein